MHHTHDPSTRMQERRASHSFEQMEGTVRVSDGVSQLIRAYKACRWTVFVVALVALLAYPTAMFPAKFCSQCFYASPGASLDSHP